MWRIGFSGYITRSVSTAVLKKRARFPFARVPERPEVGAVGGGHSHLDRILDPVRVTGLLDETDRARDGGRRIVLEAERQGEVEEHFRVGRAFDLGIERRVDGDD